jgi:putative membrane protein
MKRTVPAALAAFAASAQAHHLAVAPDAVPIPAWNLEPWLIACLGASAALYAVGLVRLWRRAGHGHGIPQWAAARFALGWLALAAALVSPIDALGGSLFWVHMVEHELLMVVAAPLLVTARPLEAWTWALPRAWRGALARFGRSRPLGALWRVITDPFGAWTLHAVALWVWHAPALFDAALANESVHVAQHASFLATALLFWWSVLARARPAGHAMASLFTTMLHTGALGALLTLAPSAWYSAYRASTAAFGLDALEDQQLGGLVMWVPAGLAYLAAGLWIAARWLGEPAARQSRP